jgi:DAK2 domain fusion protein YloV
MLRRKDNREFIDAELFSRMLCCGAASLQARKEEVNRLNVFPVPDGDTGSNMFLTIDSVRSISVGKLDLSAYAAAAAKATMRSARGNSGVILSLFFRGMADAFAGHKTADTKLLIDAFRSGAESARNAVMKPVEGTILTVMRECTIFGESDFPKNIDGAIAGISKLAVETLKKTPDMLPALKKANVVDSGGFGFTIIIDGMIAALKGVSPDEIAEREAGADAPETRTDADFAAFSDEDIKFGFCTECLINRKEGIPEKQVNDLRPFLNDLGDSIVLVADNEIVKVHVHTNEPMKVISRMMEFGEPHFIKVENMRQQHSAIVTANEQESQPALRDEYGIVTVANGDGLKNLFTELGVGYVIAGGQSMNPSTDDFLKAIRSLGCRKVILLPNNSNIVLAAKQAANLAEEFEVSVVKTTTIPQGVSALLAFNPDASPEENVESMTMAAESVLTLSIARAVKSATVNDISVRKRQLIGIVNNDLFCAANTVAECLTMLAEEIGDREIITIYYGKGISAAEAEKTADIMRGLLSPRCDVTVVPGKQPIYHYIISAE